MDRVEFKQHVLRIHADMSDSVMNDEEPFWIPEYREGWKASYFIECKTIGVKRVLKSKIKYKHYVRGFWDWCRENLSKVPMCFMSDTYNNIEWWGFNTEEDAMLFMLMWS